MKFCEYLVQSGVVSEEAVKSGLQTQKYRPMKLGRLLRNLGHIKQTALDESLRSFLKPREIRTVEEALDKIKKSGHSIAQKEWAKKHGIIPFETKNAISSYLTTVFRDEVIEDGEAKFGGVIELVLVEPINFKYLCAHTNSEMLNEGNVISITRNLSDDDKISQTDPYTQLFRDTILEAQKTNASDIHIQPTRDGVDIRLRICGDLKSWKVLSVEHRHSFINEVKRLTNLSIAVSGRAQDGRISFKNWKLDIRASLLPSQYGEKIVLRLLDLTRSFDLEKTLFDSETKNDLKRALKAKNGVIIISGPTGSGKTTTLYTLLSSLDRTGKNIITLEDPIEYGIEGLTQVQVSPKLKFSDALRAVLRQDPDIILVGEVRDAETADLCVKAALTGHLVLSTLHANGAQEVVSRLLNLGIDHFSLKSSLRFCAAQRLIKKICSSCALKATHERLQSVMEELSDRGVSVNSNGNYRIRNIAGCKNCYDGLSGRLPILEYIKSSEIETYLQQEEGSSVGITRSLLSKALELAEKGEVDVFDALEIN